MAVGDAYVFPGFLTPVLTLLFFPKPPTTFLTCFCIGERRKYAGKRSHLNRGSNSQPPGHESDTLTTESPGRGLCRPRRMTMIDTMFFLQMQPLFYVDRHISAHSACVDRAGWPWSIPCFFFGDAASVLCRSTHFCSLGLCRPRRMTMVDTMFFLADAASVLCRSTHFAHSACVDRAG